MQNARLMGISAGAAVLLAFAAPQAAAQEDTADASAEARRYTVEVIVFRYAQDVSVGSEVFLPEPPEELPQDGRPDDAQVFGDVPVAAQAAAPQGGDEAGQKFDFVLHGPQQYSLTDTYRRLERLDVYDPLLHVAWTQTTLPEEQTRPVDLLALAEAPPGLEGSFKLYLSRYLHLVVDLTLDASPQLRYRIAEDRIFKSGDLRYFDHPKFGVLAKITRVEQDAEDGVEQEMLGYDPTDLPGGDSQ